MKWIKTSERKPAETKGFAKQIVTRWLFEDGTQLRVMTANQLADVLKTLVDHTKLEWLDEDYDPLIEIYKDLKFMADKADSPLTKAAFGVALTICEDHLSNSQYPNPNTHLLNKPKNKATE
jgi:hypothetical protein